LHWAFVQCKIQGSPRLARAAFAASPAFSYGTAARTPGPRHLDVQVDAGKREFRRAAIELRLQAGAAVDSDARWQAGGTRGRAGGWRSQICRPGMARQSVLLLRQAVLPARFRVSRR